MNESRFSNFITGALVGLGLGLLIAPKEGNETRRQLKESLNNLLESVKEIDIEETKALFMKQLSKIKDDMNDMSDEAKLKIMKEKIEHIKTTCEELALVAEEKSSEKVVNAAKAVEKKAEEILNDIKKTKEEPKTNKQTNKKISNSKKTSSPKKTTTSKKKTSTKKTNSRAKK